MPYIKQERRIKIDPYVEHLEAQLEEPGELNYAFTKLALAYLDKIDGRYEDYNEIMGVFVSARDEFYRRAVAPYEDKKRQENGDVY